jgi:hypothetical protein
MQQLTTIWEFIKYTWSVLGPLVGILTGAYIANRNERKHWVADNKRREYQELIIAMMRSAHAMRKRDAPPGLYATEEQHHFFEIEEEVLHIMGSRIFIRDEMTKLKTIEQWSAAIKAFNRTGNGEAFDHAFTEISAHLTAEARKLMK